jgi:hypothetical protein
VLCLPVAVSLPIYQPSLTLPRRDKVAETGRIDCRVCGESYQCRISYLSDPVDVYCEVRVLREGEGAPAYARASPPCDPPTDTHTPPLPQWVDACEGARDGAGGAAGAGAGAGAAADDDE